MAHDEPVITPGGIVLTLILMGISTLFAGTCAAYIYTLVSTGIDAPHPPLTFLINIPVLITARLMLRNGLGSYDTKRYTEMARQLTYCLCLTVLFIILQIIGWVQFFKQIPVNASQSRSFLFVLSALHLVHVLAGMPFLVRFLWQTRGEVERLGLTIAGRRGYLKGLVRYWSYLDILWILLVCILWVTYLLNWL